MSASADAAGGKQPRRMSPVEAIANVLVGYGLAVLTQILVFPLMNIEASIQDNPVIGGVFALMFIVRSYTIRIIFEGCHN